MHALTAKVTSILIRQTTHVRHVRTDMCKTPTTRIVRLAWFVRTVKVEQVHKLHVQIVRQDSLATTVFARHARMIQYQQAPVTTLAQVAKTAEWQTPAERSVSVPCTTRVPQASPALAPHVSMVKFQTRIEPSAFPPCPAVRCARSRLRSLPAAHAFPARITSILIRQTTHVRHVRSDMCKTPTTRIVRLAWFVRTVKVEQVHKPHVRIVRWDSLATTVFARHARTIQYQQAPVTPIARLAKTAERQTPATHSVSVPTDKRERLASPAFARHVPAMKFQTLTEPTALFVPPVKPASAVAASVHLVPGAAWFRMQTLVPVFHVRRVNTRLAIHDANHVPPDNSLVAQATLHANHARPVKLPAARATLHARHVEPENTPLMTEAIVRLVRTDNNRPRRKTVVPLVRTVMPARLAHARHVKPDNARLTINPRVKLVRTDNNRPQTERDVNNVQWARRERAEHVNDATVTALPRLRD